MKAYELKIALRGQSPEVWRRVLVPEELTFSQLALVFNLAMGWEKETVFSFLLPHKKMVITELSEEQAHGERLKEAALVQICSHLERAGAFLYLYANRREMRHDVHLEKIVEPWSGRAPQVLEWSGARTAAAVLEGAKDAEDSVRYDMDAVNEKLALWCRLDRRRYEDRPLTKLYEDMEAGRYGLSAYKYKMRSIEGANATPEAQKTFFSTVFHQRLQDTKDEERVPPTLRDMFAGFAKEELLSIAEQKGIEVRHGMRKQDIIRQLTKQMLDPRVMEEYFLCLSDEEVLSLQQLLANLDDFEEEPQHNFETLSTAGYIAETPEFELVISRDVAAGFIPFAVDMGEELYDRRRRRTWLINTILTANVLYSVTPLDILCRIYNQGGIGDLKPAEIKKEMEKIPPEFLAGYWQRGDVFISEGLDEEEIRVILESQGDGDFYIPATEEIPLFAQGLALSDPNDEQSLGLFFHETLSYDEEETVEIMRHIHWTLLAGAPVSFVRDMLKDDGYFDALTKEQDVTLRRLLNRLHDSTRSVANRGFTTNEIKERQQAARAKKEERKKASRQKVIFLKDRNKEKSH